MTKITNQAIFSIVIAFFLSLLGCAGAPTTEIQLHDFKNFTYQHLECDELPNTVTVTNGIYTTNKHGYEVMFSVDKVIFVDLDSDGDEEAIVLGRCAMQGANFTLAQVFIYAIKDMVTMQLSGLSDQKMQQTYLYYYPDGTIWQLADIKKDDDLLSLEINAEGDYCCPEYLVTFRYHIVDNKLKLESEPERMAIKHK
jgi:hypothetical protein